MGLRISDALVTNIGTLSGTDAIPIDRVGVNIASKTTPANISAFTDLQTKNYISMDITPTSVPTTEGTISWDVDHHTLSIQSDSSPILQVGQEDWIHVYNGTLATIPNGSVVYISGHDTGYPAVALAQANTEATSKAIGIITQDISSLSYGFVTCRGVVHGLNTSAYTPPAVLWLSSTIAGAMQEQEPLPNSYAVPIAISITNSLTDGMLYVNVGNTAATLIATKAAIASKDPTGFINNESIDVSYNSTNKTITLTGDLTYVWRGVYRTLTSPWTSTAHGTTANVGHFLSSTDGVNFGWSTDPWSFYHMMVAYVYYGTTYKFAIREVHGTMPWQTHEEFHSIVGTYKLSGGAISAIVTGSTTAANRRPAVAQTVTKDEDIRTTILARAAGSYSQAFLTGATPTNDFLFAQTDIVALSGNNPYYNLNSGGTWSQQLMGNNSYQSIWLVAVPVTSDAGSQAYRFVWMQGQTNGTLAQEQAVTPATLELGGMCGVFSEFVFMAQVIIQFTAANWTVTQVRDLTRRVAL